MHKKLIALLMFFSCIMVYADDVVGKWKLSEVDWQNNTVVIGTITFQEDGAYIINHKDGKTISNTWAIDGDFFTLAFHGFSIEWKSKNIFYLIPAFGGSEGKKYIFIREQI